MTGLAVREEQDQGAELALVSTSGLGRWAQEARQASAVAVSLAKTPFVPASLRDRDAGITAANITAAILTGQELGLEPMAALRSIDVIQGTPALRAMTMRAVTLAHGHELWLAESTNTRAVVRGRRKGTDQVQESIWTMDRAKALNLSGKDNWRKQPAAMLVARATAECARLIAADALLGMPYSIEELVDDEQIDRGEAAGVVEQSPQPRRTAQRRRPQQPAAGHRPPVTEARQEPDPEPDFDDEAAEPVAAAQEPAPSAEVPITQQQLKKLHALYGELAIADRDERLADVSSFLGRDVASSSDLTKDEGSRLIDDLERRVSGMTPEEAAELFPEPPQ